VLEMVRHIERSILLHGLNSATDSIHSRRGTSGRTHEGRRKVMRSNSR
jgi:hypothetical protein